MLPAGGQLPNANAVLYTVPEGRAADIANISLVNTDAAAVTLNLGVRLASGGALLPIIPVDLSLGAKAQAVREQPLRLESGDTIEGSASTTNVVKFVISGEEKWSVWKES